MNFLPWLKSVKQVAKEFLPMNIDTVCFTLSCRQYNLRFFLETWMSLGSQSPQQHWLVGQVLAPSPHTKKNATHSFAIRKLSQHSKNSS
jgi:hypothetical protein